MYLLNDLWYGNVNPSERFARRGSEYRKLIEEANELMEQLAAELTPKGAEILENLLDKHMGRKSSFGTCHSGYRP